MIIQIAIWFYVTKCAVTQLNGEFWWLNEHVAKIHGERVSPPKFEHLSAFVNDESDKIVFRDNDNHISRQRTQKNSQNEKNTDKKELSSNKFIWPTEEKQYICDSTTSTPKQIDKQETNTHNTHLTDGSMQSNVKTNEENHLPKENKDVLIFSYPDSDNFISNEKASFPTNNTAILLSNTIIETNITSNVLLNEKLEEENKIKGESQVQNICTYMKKNECCRRNGLIYNAATVKKQTAVYLNLICCILPISETKVKSKYDSAIIYFPESPCINNNRVKRSNNEEISIALKQRNVLLQRRYGTQTSKIKPPNTQTRIVNEDDYVDPYWNIKNSNFHGSKNPNTNEQTKHEYENDYVEDYVVELPKPGLIGLYSDHQNSAGWSFLKENKGIYGANTDYDANSDDDEDDASFFGYSTIDPRLTNSKMRKHGRPMKITTTTSGEMTYDSESQTINYQSNPDFQVLQGFKLLNLLRNRSRVYSKNVRKTVTKSDVDESKETTVTNPFDISSESFEALGGDDEQLYKGCGKTVNEPSKAYDEEKQIGEALDGSHPWIALVVRTQRKQDVLCYATLVHPRAAVTAADCVYGTSPGEITLVAGMWNLKERARLSNRVASIHLHSQYKPGSLSNNLALLYWMNPLRLGFKIQPSCLADPVIGENCMLYGWGGFDQAIRMRSRWQRATILSSRECNSRLSTKHGVDLPNNAFCASVTSRGTVTGTGGPLICEVDGHSSTVGMAVWRDNVLVLLPAREWAMRASTVLMAD